MPGMRNLVKRYARNEKLDKEKSGMRNFKQICQE
jgi:hypothetical protein